MSASPSTPAFLRDLSAVLASSLDNDHTDNFDHDRFGPEVRVTVDRQKGLELVLGSLDALAGTYELLADAPSRQLFVELLAYRILGHRKVKLPLGHTRYRDVLAQAGQLLDRSRSIPTGFQDGSLYYMDLQPIGIPLQLYGSAGVVLSDFIIKQYEHTTATGKQIGVREGDVVIDAGACWGDTALTFALRAGSGGRVYSCEFLPDNLRIFHANLDLNPALRDRIEIVPHAVWRTSDERLRFEQRGPGTKVQTGNAPPDPVRCQSIAIDDLVRERGIPRVSFIKMDIEGAEMAAIEGAAGTIRRFRPRLAISVYHRFTDLTEIPAALHALVPEYEFTLGHYSMHLEETVLYATT